MKDKHGSGSASPPPAQQGKRGSYRDNQGSHQNDIAGSPQDTEEEGWPVELYVYDLSLGMARNMSMLLLGQQIDGVWHTSIVVFGREYFFGQSGILQCPPEKEFGFSKESLHGGGYVRDPGFQNILLKIDTATVFALELTLSTPLASTLPQPNIIYYFLKYLPGGTRLGQPNQIFNLGVTHITKTIFLQHITELRSSTFTGPNYNLFTYNCNTFSNELASFLCGGSVPPFILNLPTTVLNTPLGQIINQFSQSPLLEAGSSGHDTAHSPRRKRGGEDSTVGVVQLEENIRNRVLAVGGLKMSDEESPTASPAPSARPPRRDVIAEVEEEERREREEKMKNREPPIVFRDFGNSVEELLDELEKSLGNVELNDDEMRCMNELREYALGSEGSWILSDEFLHLISRILLNGDSGIGDDSRVNCLKVLAWLAVTKDDVILVLHQDRRDHVIMRYASHIDQLSPPCQEAISLLICNLFENLSTSEWLLYISEWESDTSRTPTSNIRVTTKVGVHALLSKEFKDIGSALVYNFLMKEVKTAVFDDVAVEMSLALLQFLSEKPPEPLMWRGLKSLLRCCQLARTEVPPLVKMVGPPPNECKGASARCDEVIVSIDAILSTVAG